MGNCCVKIPDENDQHVIDNEYFLLELHAHIQKSLIQNKVFQQQNVRQ